MIWLFSLKKPEFLLTHELALRENNGKPVETTSDKVETQSEKTVKKTYVGYNGIEGCRRF